MKRRVLILTGRYVPGFRDGGPVRSILNLTEWLGDEYDIRIMCLDRDHGDTCAYPDIKTGVYTTVGKAGVWYTEKFEKETICRLSEEADVVYVCGPYSDYARIVLRLNKNGNIKAPVYVASMGSFSPEAFRIKGGKKRIFISLMKLTGMFRNITWSVTSAREEGELKAIIGSDAKCVIAEDLPRRQMAAHTLKKEKDVLKLVFISRISRKKNLAAAADIIKHTDPGIRIKLDIYGPAEDKEYLHECMFGFDEIKRSHPNFKWEYKKEADSENVPDIFAGYDAFVFPTLGENYGHVIAESMSAGCIPVISDTTPWLDLDERDCGYVCPLSDNTSFAKALDSLAAMGEEEIDRKRNACYGYIESLNERAASDSGYRRIFG